MSKNLGVGEAAPSDDLLSTSRYMAEQLAVVFKAHDKGLKSEAVDACRRVDELQLPFLGDDDVELASTAFVEALWAKDEIELQYLRNGSLDTEGIRNADYGPVKQKLRQRAAILGADSKYAIEKATAWRRHKAGGDYWTPYMNAQMHELRAVLQDPEYPRKPRYGESGPGPEPMRYVLATELHDMHADRYWKQGIEVLIPYFMRILEEHDDIQN